MDTSSLRSAQAVPAQGGVRTMKDDSGVSDVALRNGTTMEIMAVMIFWLDIKNVMHVFFLSDSVRCGPKNSKQFLRIPDSSFCL